MEESEKHLLNCHDICLMAGIETDIKATTSNSRLSELVFHRALYVMILRQAGLTFAGIGAILNRKHCSIIYLSKYFDKDGWYQNRFSTEILLVQAYSIAESNKENYIKRIEYYESMAKKYRDALNSITPQPTKK